ncbi:MAG: UbiA family prenyltransferase [Thermoguttaceae bacterium]|jgi:4-hydroxybenzoate polyprenyltransferase|nr:UbiA family prenyltransferase [Thermoguttaceae bacterium]
MRDDSRNDSDDGPTGVGAYLELVRLPNLFTAAADVVMGFLATHAVLTSADHAPFGLLIASSCALYAAGVTLNDVFDRHRDAAERPERPIPSGRVPLGAALALGWGLLAFGLVLAGAAAVLSGEARPAVVAALLAGVIVAYDAVLKTTPLGPLAMGACRALNVLLGMSLFEAAWLGPHWLVASAVGVYIVGVTWFARSEARPAGRGPLVAATVVVLAGIGCLVLLPAWVFRELFVREVTAEGWYLLLAILGMHTAVRCFQAIAEPEPQRIQLTVRYLILTLAVLDMAACLAFRGVPGAVAVLATFLPAVVLSRWIPTT